MLRTKLISAIVGSLMISAPASAEGLGLSLEDFLTKIKASASAEGAALDVKKVNCAENPKPGDETKKIISCSHSAGKGKIFITNADPAGPLLDITTQMWPEEQAPKVLSWIAAAINETPTSDHSAATEKLIADAKTNNTSAAAMGKGEFVVLSMGKNFMISVSAP